MAGHARPADAPTGPGGTDADLVVVGGGFTGLWTVLRAVERRPGRRVVLLEADRLAEHATGRNGGFCEAGLTHGEANGRDRDRMRSPTWIPTGTPATSSTTTG